MLGMCKCLHRETFSIPEGMWDNHFGLADAGLMQWKVCLEQNQGAGKKKSEGLFMPIAYIP